MSVCIIMYHNRRVEGLSVKFLEDANNHRNRKETRDYIQTTESSSRNSPSIHVGSRKPVAVVVSPLREHNEVSAPTKGSQTHSAMRCAVRFRTDADHVTHE